MIDEGPFAGVDTSRQPDALPQGVLSRADNVVLDRGDLLTRPGVRGQLASSEAAAVYAPTQFLASGEGSVVYTANGGLYKWARGATSRTAINDGDDVPIVVDSNDAFIAAGPTALYLVDGTAALRRVTLASAVSVSALTRPGAPSATTLAAAGTGAQILPDVDTTGDWTQPLSHSGTEELITEPNFPSALGSGIWNVLLGDPTRKTGGTHAPMDGGENYVELDYDNAAPEFIISDALTLPLNGDSDGGKLFLAELRAWGTDDWNGSASPQSVAVRAQLYSDLGGSTLIAGTNTNQTGADILSAPHAIDSETTVQTLQYLIDLRDVEGVPLAAKMVVGAPDASGTQGVNVNGISLLSPRQAFSLSASAGSLVVSQGSVLVWQGQLMTRGLKLVNIAGVSDGQDWSGYKTVFLGATLASGISDVRLRLLLYSGGSWVEGPEMDAVSDGFVATLTGIASSVLADVDGIAFEFVEDCTATGFSTGGSQAVMTITGVFAPGNLTADLRYWYKTVEIDASEDPTNVLDVLESDVSESSTVIVPSVSRRMGRVVIPARSNADARYLAVYRYGGDLIDPERGAYPLGFLLGILDLENETNLGFGEVPAIGGTYPAAPANQYLSWSPLGAGLGGTLIDNTPDGWLVGARIAYEGREPAPSAPRDVAVWDERVWLVDGDTDVYGSWKLSSNRRAGLYFTRTFTGAGVDPHAPLRGWWGRLQLPAGDSVQKVVPVNPSAMAILTQTGLWILAPGDMEHATRRYSAQRVEGAPGLLARRAACVHDGALFWLAPDGIYRWQGGAAERVGDPVREYLPPRTEATQAALRTSAAISWGRRLLFLVPSASGDSAPTTALVWDSQEGGWTRWTGLGATGGCVLRAPAQAEALVLGGTNGQVQLVTEAGGDRTTSGASVADVAVAIRTRAQRAQGVDLVPGRWFYDVVTGEAGDVTLVAEGDVDAADHSKTQTLAEGAASDWVRASRGARGRSVRAGLDAASTERLRVKRLGLELVEGTRS